MRTFPPFCHGFCFPDRAVKSAQIGLFCKLLAGVYHPWGLPWSGADPEFTHAVGMDTSASPSVEEVMPVRRHHQQAVRETLENLTDAGLAEVRAAPDSPGYPNGEHFVLQCLHVLLNEEWEHHRYTVRDLDVLDPADEASGS